MDDLWVWNSVSWTCNSKDTKKLKSGLTTCKITLTGDDEKLKAFFDQLEEFSSRNPFTFDQVCNILKLHAPWHITRFLSVCEKARITSIQELANFTAGDFLRLKDVGRRTYLLADEFLHRQGYSFKE